MVLKTDRLFVFITECCYRKRRRVVGYFWIWPNHPPAVQKWQAANSAAILAWVAVGYQVPAQTPAWFNDWQSSSLEHFVTPAFYSIKKHLVWFSVMTATSNIRNHLWEKCIWCFLIGPCSVTSSREAMWPKNTFSCKLTVWKNCFWASQTPQDYFFDSHKLSNVVQ